MKGGTLFKLTPYLANLKSQGDHNSCGACVLSTLKFPLLTVQRCIMHSVYQEGTTDNEMLDYVKELEDSVYTQLLHKVPLEDSTKSKFVYYGISKDKTSRIITRYDIKYISRARSRSPFRSPSRYAAKITNKYCKKEKQMFT